jgi:Histidine phosphatase superfamily (branch 1)
MVPWVYAAVTLCLSFPEYHGFISFLGLNKGRGTIVERLNLADPANLYDGDRTNRRDFFITATKWITFPCASEPLLPKDGRATCLNSDDSALTSSSLLCLQDLPTYDPKTTVRLYLCRHGETENNRLNIIQGARVDPPINEKGSRQAMLLGLALSNAAHPPSLVLHSPLLRAKQTAQLASEQLLAGRSSEKRMIEMRNLKDLAEVDFGSMAEGAPVSQYRSEMMSLYCAWALGILDARMPGGGESGYEVRICQTKHFSSFRFAS